MCAPQVVRSGGVYERQLLLVSKSGRLVGGLASNICRPCLSLGCQFHAALRVHTQPHFQGTQPQQQPALACAVTASSATRCLVTTQS